MKPVLNKRDMRERLQAGEFGNTTRLWPDVLSYLKDDFDGVVALRSYCPGKPFFAQLTKRQVLNLSTDESYYVQEVADASHYTFAGELTRNERGLCLRFTFVKKPMRDAFAQCELTAERLTAKYHLERHVEPEDLEHLSFLLDAYPGHVIEFTCLDIPVGILKRRMLIWEVRAY